VNTRFGRAWVLLALAILLHVIDEAVTGFLVVYNPTVMAWRERWPWLPFPVLQFEWWLGGLLAGVLFLLFVSRWAYRGAGWMKVSAWILAVIMIFNGVGHIAGTIFGPALAALRVARPLPGFYSSPVLIAAAVYLIHQLRAAKPGVRPAAGPRLLRST
jgi:hypothetical protein